MKLRDRALQLLARRDHTRKELEHKLAQHAQDPGEVEEVLAEAERRGWLSESRLTEQVIHARRGRFGARRIEHELRTRGVSEEAVAAAASQLKAGELEAARAVWRKKFGRLPTGQAERARQARFLQGRGFDMEVVLKVLKGEDGD